jgi:hypothetical protein
MLKRQNIRALIATVDMDSTPTRKVPRTDRRHFLGLSLSGAALLLAGETLAQDPILARYDVTPRPIDLIPPGTVVEKSAPEPYTHLIIKTFPRLGAGDLDAVNDMTKELASFLHTALVAKVEPHDVGGQRRYRLAEVATGFSANIPGRGDTVLSPDTEKKLGANLGFLARVVLSRVYEEQQKCRYLVRCPTMAIIDTPAIVVRDGKHRWVLIRYAVLVSERSGRLDTLVWTIDLDGQGRATATVGEISLMPPNMIFDGIMHVDSSYFTLGIPSDLAFATATPPKTDRFAPVPESLKTLSALPQYTREQAKTMEIELWKVLQQLASQR